MEYSTEISTRRTKMKKLSIILIPLTLVMLLSAGCTLATPEISSPTPKPAVTAPPPTSKPPVTAPSPTPKPATAAPSPTVKPILTSELSPGTGMIDVYVTDPPPPDMEKILVDIKNLEVHKAGGNWTAIAVDTDPFDLKAIEGIQQFLASQIVETGKYTQIRFEVNSVTIVVAGDNHTAKVPSDKIKLVGNFNVIDNNTTEITLDFNGEKSVLVTGKGNYIFKPVIKLLVSDKGKPVKPVELEASWEASDNATAELSTEQAKSPNESVHLWTEGIEGVGNEARIIIPMPTDTELGDIESISWWVWTVDGYPPHVDIVMDIDGDTELDDEDMLTAEMAYNNADGIELDEGLTPTIGEWLQTFELASGDGYGASGNGTMLWVTKMGAGNDDAPWGTLADWKDGVVANDPGSDGLSDNIINSEAPVLRLEIEIDNWVHQTNAYVDDIEIVIDGVTYSISF